MYLKGIWNVKNICILVELADILKPVIVEIHIYILGYKYEFSRLFGVCLQTRV